MSHILKALVLSATGLTLTACFNVLPEPDPANSIYRLSSNLERSEYKVSAPIVRIETPSADRLVATRRIVVSPDANRLAVASGAEWADSLPKLIQKSLVETLAARPDIVGVIPRVGAKSDYRIHINVDKFEARFDNGPEAAPMIIVAYTATFAQAGSRDLLGTRQFKTTQRANGFAVSDIVAAMNAANNSNLDDLADWMSGYRLQKKS